MTTGPLTTAELDEAIRRVVTVGQSGRQRDGTEWTQANLSELRDLRDAAARNESAGAGSAPVTSVMLNYDNDA